MFISEALKTHLETSATVRLNSLVVAEWNMNLPENIYKLGNYRYRPSTSGSKFFDLPNSFDQVDSGGYYTGATDASITINGGVKDNGSIQKFILPKEKMKMLYSLDECIKPFRPRSGINKLLYLDKKYLANSGANIAQRPRYYMSSRYDQFKYWTSYRTEGSEELGIAKNVVNNLYYIDDAVPFVVYKDVVPANRLVVKMQTNVGTVNLGPFRTATGTIDDPLFGTQNQTTPLRWRIQYLSDNNNWIDLYTFNENSTRDDGSQIIGPDGYVELQYGLKVPQKYRNIFIFADTISSETLLPEESVVGYAYLVVPNEGDLGTFYIWTGSEYETFVPEYGWYLGSETINKDSSFVRDFTSPEQYSDSITGSTIYREFQYLKGVRIVVETMNKINSTFDLIEFSPRLVADMSDRVIDFKITKTLSDLSTSSLPVGQLLASNGEVQIFDNDQSFNYNNTDSIISKYTDKNIKFVFYETIIDVDGIDYYIPIKTLYSNSLPQADVTSGTISLSLRDFYFFLESTPAPRLMMTNTSLSMAISTLLDFVGFSNYAFRRLDNESDPIIPYFFVAPDQNVAEVLNQLAIATQSAMFFDEYNNFIVMSKNYLMPTTSERPTDFTLSGQANQTDSGVVENQSSGNLPNILSIASQDKKIINDGRINYTTRYIQRSYGSLRQASMVDQEKTWIYKPALLWEVSGDESTKTVNEIASTQGKFVLGAMPLNSDLSINAPVVRNNVIVNNTIDVGENVYWLTRYQGYLYSAGEVIRYDAAEFNITGVGNVWISSNQEYQKYFASLPFNGKIYPTGLLRIYAVPYYETISGVTRLQNGPVEKHGRGQFGTPVVYHSAGVSGYWTDNANVRGCSMESKYLFTTAINLNFNISGVSSSGTTLSLPDIAGIEVGQFVKVVSGAGAIPSSTTVSSINTVKNTVTNLYSIVISASPTTPLSNAIVNFTSVPTTDIGEAGVNSSLARQTTRNSIIKNFMATSYLSDSATNNLKSTQSGTIQSSALVMNGPAFAAGDNPLNFISYVYRGLAVPEITTQEINSAVVAPSPSTTVVRPVPTAYKNFGTRMRIIGKIESNENRSQTPIGSTPYYQVTSPTPNQSIVIGGGSGGLAFLLNPETNNGYYFEIVALTEKNIESYLQFDNAGNSTISINNVVFYKIKQGAGGSAAVPIKLWGGLTNIIVDDGRFTGQYRMAGEENTTVYDLSVEYQDIGSTRRFYLYINNKLIQVVDDPDPLPTYNNMALFVRGSSRCMFENIYALAQNYGLNSSFQVGQTLSDVFGDKQVDANEAFKKYAISGIIQNTYLSGIASQEPPRYNMYFDEFGTIMRECAYFDIKYDRSYPALYAKLSPTFNRIKGYTVSGFQADSYGAEFLIFNATDTALNLDETSGNYLRIQGITFTQDTSYQLTVDEYFNKRGNFADPELKGSTLIISPLIEKEKYDKIRLSRLNYGTNEFNIDSIYIQTQDDANNLMGWIIDKVMTPKKAVGVNMFSIPTIQLGDIVNINYKDSNGLDLVSPETTRYVVYNIEYSRSLNGPNMTLYLSEV